MSAVPVQESRGRRAPGAAHLAVVTLGALLLAAAAAIFGLWSLWGADLSDPADEASPEIVYRRDVVRELAEAQRAFDAGGKPLDSTHEGHPD